MLSIQHAKYTTSYNDIWKTLSSSLNLQSTWRKACCCKCFLAGRSRDLELRRSSLQRSSIHSIFSACTSAHPRSLPWPRAASMPLICLPRQESEQGSQILDHRGCTRPTCGRLASKLLYALVSTLVGRGGCTHALCWQLDVINCLTAGFDNGIYAKALTFACCGGLVRRHL